MINFTISCNCSKLMQIFESQVQLLCVLPVEYMCVCSVASVMPNSATL